MPRETSPGLKILWLWTIGTAGSTLSNPILANLFSLLYLHMYDTMVLQFLLQVWWGQG